MIIGVPKEIKDHETRVGLVPSGVMALREAGHEVLVETRAGEGSSIADREYKQAGGAIVQTGAEVWSKADLVVKVKEPQDSRVSLFPARSDPVHVPAPGAAAGADRQTGWPPGSTAWRTKPSARRTAPCRCSRP